MISHDKIFRKKVDQTNIKHVLLWHRHALALALPSLTFKRYMLICRNAEEVHGQRRVGNPWLKPYSLGLFWPKKNIVLQCTRSCLWEFLGICGMYCANYC